MIPTSLFLFQTEFRAHYLKEAFHFDLLVKFQVPYQLLVTSAEGDVILFCFPVFCIHWSNFFFYYYLFLLLDYKLCEIRSYNLATWCEKLTLWKRLWCWERLKTGGEGGYRGWDGWMASLTQWTCVWTGSGRWWRTGKPGIPQFMGLQKVGHNLATEQQQQIGFCFTLSTQCLAQMWPLLVAQ